MKKKENHRKKYSDDFRQKIVQEFIVSKQTLSVFSHRTGIDNSTLSRWIKKHCNECETVPEMIDNKWNLAEDVIALKKEIASIKETVDVLKKILEKKFSEKYAIEFAVSPKKK
jgi:transposase-like protein